MGILTSPLRLFLERFGVDVDRHSRSYAAQRNALLHSYDVTTVVDVGANEGQYGTTLRTEGFRGAILSVEPLAASFEHLARRCTGDARWNCVKVALGPTAGRCDINVAGNRVSSSILAMHPRHAEAAPDSRYAGIENVEVCRLDDLCRDWGLFGERLAVKLDVQGYELEVLAGGREALGSAVVVESEVSLRELYDGQPLIGDVLPYMSAHGFRPVALQQGFRDPRTSETLQLDVLFARDQDVAE